MLSAYSGLLLGSIISSDEHIRNVVRGTDAVGSIKIDHTAISVGHFLLTCV